MDSQGKNKVTEGKARNGALLAIFLVGLCIGVVVAERVYIARGGRVPKPRFLRTHHDSLRSIVPSADHASSGNTAAAESGALPAYSDSLPPRNDLEELLRKIAPKKEVLVAVANKNVNWDGMLATFTNGIKAAGISNHLIVALDQETKSWADVKGINAYLLNLEVHKAQAGTGDNHAVSAMKFGILKRFVELGYAVLLSDVDISILQNPFDFLYRDSDVEGMTDGFDEPTAYGSIEGFDDPSMGWARFAQFYKHFNMNSGLFYLRANKRTLELLVRLETRLSKQKYWDQTAYNEEIFFLSHGSYKSPQVSVRVMEIDKFMNSKRLFKDIRHRPKSSQPPKPVTVHVNYHPDKHERMKAIFKYYNEGDEHALEPFPGGSEQGSR
ncbi:glycosyltransferase, partial [Haematococcus lacustris]